MIELPSGIMAGTFDEAQKILDGPEGMRAEALIIEIGARGKLGAADIVHASEMLHLAIGKLTGEQCLVLSIGGYDQDPRELWSIPDVVTFVRRVMRCAGIVHWQHPAVAMLDETTLALLLQCDVFGKDHPWLVNTGSGVPYNRSFRRYNRRG